MLGQRDSNPVAGGRGHQFGGFVPGCPATAVLFGTGQANEAEFVEAPPQRGVALDRRRGRVLVAVIGEHRVHHLDEGAVNGGPGAHRMPNPRASTPRNTSLVPPRSVKPGR